MTAVTLAAAIVLSLHGPTGAQCSDHRGLVAFADAFDRAQLSKDSAALEAMVADSMIFIDGSGKRLGKSAFIKGWTAPGDQFDPVVLSDRQVVRLGPTAAIVTAEAVVTGRSDGQRFVSKIRFSDTFQCSRGIWQAVHIQVTRLAAPAK